MVNAADRVAARERRDQARRDCVTYGPFNEFGEETVLPLCDDADALEAALSACEEERDRLLAKIAGVEALIKSTEDWCDPIKPRVSAHEIRTALGVPAEPTGPTSYTSHATLECGCGGDYKWPWGKTGPRVLRCHYHRRDAKVVRFEQRRLPASLHTTDDEEVRDEHERIERACEAAIQEGLCGVLLLRDPLGALVSAAPNASVPYGEIHSKVMT